jgi:predicted nucleotidyltransferase
MKKYDDIFLSLVDDFSKHKLVEAVLLSGSRTTGNFDKNSDYDLYIYSNKEIPLDFRKEMSNKYFNYFELNNTTWEKEDQGFFKGINIPIDIVYRNLNWIENMLEEIVIKCQASTGYTTCFWANIINSDILYDKNGELERIQNKFDVDYSEKLRKNFPLLNQIIPAYTHQVEKALKRDDYISVNHRITAFFESYFDIIFAINKTLHLGEKKLLKITTEELDFIPKNMESDIKELFDNLYNREFDIINKLDDITNELKDLLVSLNLI